MVGKKCDQCNYTLQHRQNSESHGYCCKNKSCNAYDTWYYTYE